jgi:hypothetical protein
VAKAAVWPATDAETRKRGDQTGLDTLVVHALNDACLVSESSYFGAGGNPLSMPPGKYGRKAETQRNWRGPAQAVDHVV